ncbi:ROK family protein [Kribbella sp. NPDC048928]|uniref:ROK family transcriptional regulator n=1 Tax=Kribbella sp. NPDC048928 TaxID=3364111 RepID=UPI00371AD3C5
MSSGPGDVLQLIRGGDAATRREIQEVTGLSRVTVAQRVDALLESGLIRETDGGHATGGRRPLRLEFNVENSVLAVAAVDTTHSRTALTRLDGAILADERLDVAVLDGPKALLTTLVESFLRLLDGAGIDRQTLGGIGVSIPGPVDPQTGRPSQPPIMPGWDAYPIIEHLQESFGLPVFVENDADAMAVGEQSVNYSGSPSLCLVKVSTGIGTGMVINGVIYHGIDGGAGDIGHIRLAGETGRCQCGSSGCLATVASGRAVAHALGVRSGSDVKRLIAEGNVDALRLTHEAGSRLGEVMATVVSMVNPGVLVVGGDLGSSSLIGGIRESLYPRSLARATRNLDVRLSTLGDDAGLIGLARIAVDNLFSAAAVNRAIAATSRHT